MQGANPMVFFPMMLLGLYARITPTQRGGYRLVRMVRRCLPAEHWSGWFTTPDGLRMELDLGTYPDCCMAAGLYELETYRLLRRLLQPGRRFVDCGANIGYFTLLAARWVGPSGRVDAFEPDLQNRDRLLRNLEANGLTRVHVHAEAVSDGAGQLTLYHPGPRGNHGMASAYLYDSARDRPQQVPCQRLDACLQEAPDVVKIDVEGGELAAVRGMEHLFAGAHPPVIIYEHNRATAAAAGFRPSDIPRAIEQFNRHYEFRIVGWRDRRLRALEDLDTLTGQPSILARRR